MFASDLTEGRLIHPPADIPGLRWERMPPPDLAGGSPLHLGSALLFGSNTYLAGSTVVSDEPWYPKPDPPSGPAETAIEQPVLSIASREISNWGSWLFRVIPKLIDDPCPDRPVLVNHQQPWQRTLLDLFAPDRSLVMHWPGKTYDLADVAVAQARNREAYFDAGTVQFYRDKAASLGGKGVADNIYLARRNARLRPLLNEDALIDALDGFVPVDLETMSIPDQIRTMRDARRIVCPGGSGLFNCVFSQAEFVLDIEPGTNWVWAHHNVMRSSGLRHSVIYGTRTEGAVHSPWIVDIGTVAKAIDLLDRAPVAA